MIERVKSKLARPLSEIQESIERELRASSARDNFKTKNDVCVYTNPLSWMYSTSHYCSLTVDVAEKLETFHPTPSFFSTDQTPLTNFESPDIATHVPKVTPTTARLNGLILHRKQRAAPALREATVRNTAYDVSPHYRKELIIQPILAMVPFVESEFHAPRRQRVEHSANVTAHQTSLTPSQVIPREDGITQPLGQCTFEFGLPWCSSVVSMGLRPQPLPIVKAQSVARTKHHHAIHDIGPELKQNHVAKRSSGNSLRMPKTQNQHTHITPRITLHRKQLESPGHRPIAAHAKESPHGDLPEPCWWLTTPLHPQPEPPRDPAAGPRLGCFYFYHTHMMSMPPEDCPRYGYEVGDIDELTSRYFQSLRNNQRTTAHEKNTRTDPPWFGYWMSSTVPFMVGCWPGQLNYSAGDRNTVHGIYSDFDYRGYKSASDAFKQAQGSPVCIRPPQSTCKLRNSEE